MKLPEKLQPVCTGALIAALVFLATGLIWRLGGFQEAELRIYDRFLVWRADPKAADPRIVIVFQTEKDIQQMDYPLRDKVLSAVLEKIESGHPTTIGLDLYRDLAEPRDGSGRATLDATLLRYPNIITIFLFGTKESPFLIPPPQAVREDPSRYGFNDFPYDYKTVRRSLLYLTDYPSLAWQLAQLDLASRGIVPAADGNDIRIGRTTIKKFHGDDGGYVHALDGGYQFLQDFRGPRDFRNLSIGDVLTLGDTSLFKDKIVLIGASADSSNDKYDTPLEKRGVRIPGVILHAQVVNQLLRAALDGEAPTASFSEATEWFWLACWCLAGAGIGFFARSHIVFAFASAAGAGLILLLTWLTFLHGYWILSVAPETGLLASATLVKAYMATHEQRERASLMRLFSQYTSPEVAEEIWNQRSLFIQGGRPAAQRLMVTVLFSDLKGYSTISETMTPDALIAWVNQCLAALARHVGANGGVVNTFMGDGMMAVFGVPVARTDETQIQRDALNAVTCAVRMAGEIRQMNARWKAEGKPPAGMRVGIFTGEAMAGTLGSDDHLEYSVIGDTVNTASRLESVDKEGTLTGGEDDCRILIGALTYRYVKDQFSVEPVGKIALKGKKGDTEVYKILILEREILTS